MGMWRRALRLKYIHLPRGKFTYSLFLIGDLVAICAPHEKVKDMRTYSPQSTFPTQCLLVHDVWLCFLHPARLAMYEKGQWLEWAGYRAWWGSWWPGPAESYCHFLAFVLPHNLHWLWLWPISKFQLHLLG